MHKNKVARKTGKLKRRREKRIKCEGCGGREKGKETHGGMGLSGGCHGEQVDNTIEEGVEGERSRREEIKPRAPAA